VSDVDKRCEDVRAALTDAAMGAAGFSPGSVDPEIRAHLRECQQCQAFLDDVVRLKQAAAEAYASAEAEVEVKSENVARAIEMAIDDGLARRHAWAAKRGRENLLERAAFLAFAAVVLAVQALLFRDMRVTWFLVLEAGLNWLAPLVFLIATLFWRPARQRREGVR
jgi:predicted anti-sigma-YlaC factor YlaD